MADCEHNWVYASETADTVTHRCTKCPATNTRPKGNRAHHEHVGRFYAVALAVMVTLCVALTIWAGGAA